MDDRQFISSSRQWGNQAAARVCQVVLESNDGATQQVIENRTDLLDFLDTERLSQCDDFGLSLPFLAVYYDRPEILKYLHKRGVDLSLPCDTMKFGNPMYYAVTLEKPRLIKVLHKLGCYATAGCDAWFNATPTHYASRIDNDYSKAEIKTLCGQTQRAATFLIKNFYRHKYRKQFLQKIDAIRLIQRVARGMIAREYVEMKRTGNLSEEGSSSLMEGSSSVIHEETSSAIREENSSFVGQEGSGVMDQQSVFERSVEGETISVGGAGPGESSVAENSVNTGYTGRSSGRSNKS